jgi:NAD(P)-dependent dehydrogenase (short-subunit alcohol dehydrogenase family)
MGEQEKQVILITGASSGMGKATAELLLKKGHIVYAAARRIEKMKDLESMGATVLFMDVTEQQSMIDGINRIIDEQGKIDVLFNNAGYGSFGAVEDVPIEEAKSQFEVNVFGLARLTQLVLPLMRKQGRGKIINTSSMGGKMVSPMGAWYHATKFAIEGFSDCLRFEAAPFGIDVVLIEPGNIQTEWNDIMLHNLKEKSGNTAYAKISDSMEGLMNRIGKFSPPELVAETVVKAIESQRPKTRYLVGKNAKSFVFLRRVTSDRMYDFILKRMMIKKH